MRPSGDDLLRASNNTPARRRSSRPTSPLLSSTPNARASSSTPTPQLREKPSLLDARSIYSIDPADRSGVSASVHSPALSAVDPTDFEDADFALEDFEESMRQSNSIDDFTKMIQDFRQERKRRSAGPVPSGSAHPARSSLGLHYANGADGSHLLSSADALVSSASSVRRNRTSSHAGSDDGSAAFRRSLDMDQDNVSTYTEHNNNKRGSWRASQHLRPLRCTCCCGRDDCERARRATIEWSDMEQDLKLAAEIGQALLRRNDALTSEASTKEAKHTSQRDSLMKRLTKSIQESKRLEKDLAQCVLNLEATDSSNRALLAELDQCRRDVKRLEADRARLITIEARADKLSRDVEDARQEARAERKKAALAESRARKANERASQLAASFNQRLADSEQERRDKREASNAEAIEQAKQRFRESLAPPSADSSSSSTSDESLAALRDLLTQNESLQSQVDQTTALLKAANEELAELREQQQFGPTSATYGSNLSRPSMHGRRASSGFSDAYRVPSHSEQTAPASQQDEGEQQEAPSTPALADEIVYDDPHRAPSRASDRSPASIIEHSATPAEVSEEAPSSSRLLSTPSMPKPRLSELSIESSRPSSGRQTPTTEAQRIRAAYSATSDAASEDTLPTTAGSLLAPSSTLASNAAKKDGRTAQLMTLLDYVQRLFVRLASADVDTLARRLQKQHLAGDVGHLARVTINGITRDAEGLRDHFRRLIEAEARGATANGREDVSSLGSGNSRDKAEKESDSLVARKEFFALVKLVRDLLFEIAKLRNVLNEVQLAPSNASKILQEHLGAATQEDTGVGAWLGKLLGGGLGSGGSGSAAAAPASSMATATGLLAGHGAAGGGGSSGTSGAGHHGTINPGLGRPSSRAGHNPGASVTASRATSRASADVLPSTIAVEVKGSRASASDSTRVPHSRSADPSGLDDSPVKMPPSSRTTTLLQPSVRPIPGRTGSGARLSHVQSRNLSGLFAGAPADGWAAVTAGEASYRPLSRIVDDDEISIHQGKPLWRGGGGGNAVSDDDEDESDDEDSRRPRMRPRGLSDSSIHSTFLDHAGGAADNEGPTGVVRARTGAPVGRMGAGQPATAAPARIMNKSTLALQAATTATSAAPPLQQQRSRGLLAGLGSTLGWGAASTTTSAPARPTLRSPASTAALSLAAASGTGVSSGSRTPTIGEPGQPQRKLSVPVDVPAGVASPKSGAKSIQSGSSTGGSNTPEGRSPNGRLAVSQQAKQRSASGRSIPTSSTPVMGRRGTGGARNAF